MKLRLCFTLAIAFHLAACGGSSSETPMPLEPVPHAEAEPRVSSEDGAEGTDDASGGTAEVDESNAQEGTESSSGD